MKHVIPRRIRTFLNAVLPELGAGSPIRGEGNDGGPQEMKSHL